MVCALVRVQKTNTLGTNFRQLLPVKVSHFKVFIVQRYGLIVAIAILEGTQVGMQTP